MIASALTKHFYSYETSHGSRNGNRKVQTICFDWQENYERHDDCHDIFPDNVKHRPERYRHIYIRLRVLRRKFWKRIQTYQDIRYA